VVAGGLELLAGEYTLETVAGDREGAETATGMLPGSGFVVLDTAVTPELAAEGLARDVVRAVQQARRDAGLDVSDRIRLVLGASGTVADALREHRDLVAGETLAGSVELVPDGVGEPVPVGDGERVTLQVHRA